MSPFASTRYRNYGHNTIVISHVKRRTGWRAHGHESSSGPVIASDQRERGVDDILVFGGGTIPTDDIPALKAAGLAAVFTPGTTTTEAIAFVKDHVRQKA
ncbi:MAG: hypothetical protein C3F08_04170 [Candidatus Methylomirabilota bacterium]|nr:MAG: hypothetical protein C3F08_04170 [candidate division NC10 bacterium]